MKRINHIRTNAVGESKYFGLAAEIDLDDLITPKLMHDIIRHYNQFSVLSRNLNRNSQRAVIEPNGSRKIVNSQSSSKNQECPQC